MSDNSILPNPPQIDNSPKSQTNATLALAALDGYLADKSLRCQPKTLTGYKNTIELFIDQGLTAWPPVRADILRWLATVEKRASKTTVCSYFGTLRAWLGYLHKSGQIEVNPAAEIQNLGLAPSRPKLKPRGVDLNTIICLFVQMRKSSDLATLRDIALIHTLYRTGARSGEIAGLTRSLLDLQTRCITLPAAMTKTDTDRQLFFGQEVANDLGRWLAALDAAGYSSPWLFPGFSNGSPQPQPLTISGVYWAFQRRLEAAGLPRYRVHELRHGFAKAAIAAGIPLSSIQRQMGHADEAQSLRYARAFSSQQQQDFATFGDPVRQADAVASA